MVPLGLREQPDWRHGHLILGPAHHPVREVRGGQKCGGDRVARAPRGWGALRGHVRRDALRGLRWRVPGAEVREARGDAGELPVVPGQQKPATRCRLQQHGGAEQRRGAARLRIFPRVPRLAGRFWVDALERPGAGSLRDIVRAHRRVVHIGDEGLRLAGRALLRGGHSPPVRAADVRRVPAAAGDDPPADKRGEGGEALFGHEDGQQVCRTERTRLIGERKRQGEGGRGGGGGDGSDIQVGVGDAPRGCERAGVLLPGAGVRVADAGGVHADGGHIQLQQGGREERSAQAGWGSGQRGRGLEDRNLHRRVVGDGVLLFGAQGSADQTRAAAAVRE
mmetsp:Transcript_11130/g.44824  ORF Transcript_11130/g.44824 Transcript_11130/m.44824 type:complete len:336 (+) Transcript_11130:127-1134(+)